MSSLSNENLMTAGQARERSEQKILFGVDSLLRQILTNITKTADLGLFSVGYNVTTETQKVRDALKSGLEKLGYAVTVSRYGGDSREDPYYTLNISW